MALWRTLGCMAALTFSLLGMTGCGDSEPAPVPPEVEANEDPVPELDVGLGTEEVEPAEVEPAEVEPAEVEPAEVEPAEVEPAEVEPAPSEDAPESE